MTDIPSATQQKNMADGHTIVCRSFTRRYGAYAGSIVNSVPAVITGAEAGEDYFGKTLPKKSQHEAGKVQLHYYHIANASK